MVEATVVMRARCNGSFIGIVDFVTWDNDAEVVDIGKAAVVSSIG